MAKGRWEVESVPCDGPLQQYDCGVKYTSIFGEDATLSAGGIPVTLTLEDADTVASILNRQIEEVQEFCLDLLAKENEL